MSISSISSSTNVYQNQILQMRKDFTALQTNLSSGDLAASQKAYAVLTQDLENTQQTQTGQQVGGCSQVSADLTAVGSALQSGDITSAQNTFATLTQDLQNAQQVHKGRHHHHHHGGNTQSTTETSGNSTNPTTVGSVINTVA